MAVSPKIADLNQQRFQQFSTPFTPKNSKAALFAFTGDAYSRLAVTRYNQQQLAFSQTHITILSGLYGLLRPLDLMQAYRLEMKTKLADTWGANLYQFWGDKIGKLIHRRLAEHQNPIIINLASAEYLKVIKPRNKLAIITINFKEIKNTKARTVAIFAKRARGLMADYIIKNQIDHQDELLKFRADNYRYSPNDSSQDQLTFIRPQPARK